jgi:hypothetical protein
MKTLLVALCVLAPSLSHAEPPVVRTYRVKHLDAAKAAKAGYEQKLILEVSGAPRDVHRAAVKLGRLGTVSYQLGGEHQRITVALTSATRLGLEALMNEVGHDLELRDLINEHRPGVGTRY